MRLPESTDGKKEVVMVGKQSQQSTPTKIRIQCDKAKSPNQFRGPKEGESSLRSALCYACYSKINLKVRNHQKRAAGIFTISNWLHILEKSQGYCYYCNKEVGIKNLTIDHHVSVREGGQNTSPNIVPACSMCNASKGSRSTDNWRYIQRSKELLKQLQEKLELSETETIQRAIYTLAEKEGLY